MPTTPVPASRTPSPAGRSPLKSAFAGLAALAVAMGIGRFAFTPLLPMMRHDAGLSIADGSLLASSNYLGYLLGALAATVVRPGPARTVRRGLVAVCAVTAAMGLPLPFWAWLGLRLLAGVASAFLLISISAWSLEALSGRSGPLVPSLVFAGVGTGIAAAGLACLALARAGASSSESWLVLGLLAAAATAGVWRTFGGPEAPHGAAARAPGISRWPDGSARLVLCYGATGFGYIIPATFLPVMAKAALGGSPLFGWSWPLFGLAAALSTPAAALLVPRLGSRPVWVSAHLVMAGGILLPALRPGLWPILAAAVCVGGTFMVVTLTALQEAKRVAGRDATPLIAAMTAAYAAGQIAGPLVVGLAPGGFSGPLTAAAAVLAASAVGVAAGRRLPGD